MQIVNFLPLILLIFFWLAQLKMRQFLSSKIRVLFYSSLFLYLILPLYKSHLLFQAGINAPAPVRFLYPPYQSLNYFIKRVNHLYWIPTIISILIALIFLFAILKLKPELRDKFFYSEEPYIICLGIMLVGHPLWIAYLILTLLIYILFSLIKGGKNRSSFYPFWIPSAILITLFSSLILKLPFISILILSK